MRELVWAVLPSSLLNLKGVEHETVSLNQIFQQVDGLELGLVGRKSRQKSIFLPLEAIDHLMQSHPGYPKNDVVQLEYEEYMKDTIQNLDALLTEDEIAAVYDLEDTAGVAAQREVPLSLQGWLNLVLYTPAVS